MPPATIFEAKTNLSKLDAARLKGRIAIHLGGGERKTGGALVPVNSVPASRRLGFPRAGHAGPSSSSHWKRARLWNGEGE